MLLTALPTYLGLQRELLLLHGILLLVRLVQLEAQREPLDDRLGVLLPQPAGRADVLLAVCDHLVCDFDKQRGHALTRRVVPAHRSTTLLLRSSAVVADLGSASHCKGASASACALHVRGTVATRAPIRTAIPFSWH